MNLKLSLAFEKDIQIAVELLKQYGCSEVYLFGSLATGKYKEDSDIDLAVKGLKKEYFFKILALLNRTIDHEIDLVLLDEKTPLTDYLINSEELKLVS